MRVKLPMKKELMQSFLLLCILDSHRDFKLRDIEQHEEPLKILFFLSVFDSTFFLSGGAEFKKI
jgi:hypothetical protein